MIELAYPPHPQQEIIVLDSPATDQLNIQISTAAAKGETLTTSASSDLAKGQTPDIEDKTK